MHVIFAAKCEERREERGPRTAHGIQSPRAQGRRGTAGPEKEQPQDGRRPRVPWRLSPLEGREVSRRKQSTALGNKYNSRALQHYGWPLHMGSCPPLRVCVVRAGGTPAVEGYLLCTSGLALTAKPLHTLFFLPLALFFPSWLVDPYSSFGNPTLEAPLQRYLGRILLPPLPEWGWEPFVCLPWQNDLAHRLGLWSSQFNICEGDFKLQSVSAFLHPPFFSSSCSFLFSLFFLFLIFQRSLTCRPVEGQQHSLYWGIWHFQGQGPELSSVFWA